MANREVVLNHDRIRNPQTITKVVSDAFKAQGMSIHKNDCLDIIDDHSGGGRRIYKVKKAKYFDMGRNHG
jgi:hypothetical protein